MIKQHANTISMDPIRTLVIGDIHGNLDALKGVLTIASYNASEDRIICLGDYIDGWHQSYEVIDYLLVLDEVSTHKNIFLKGNHDQWLIDVFNKDFHRFRDQDYIRMKYEAWIRNHGNTTYQSYLAHTTDEIEHHKIHFFDHLQSYHLEDNKLFVHAGFDETLGFQATATLHPEVLLWDRRIFQKAVALWQYNEVNPMLSQRGTFNKIYIGHTPTVAYGIHTPVKMGNVINLDQGCKINGTLTAWVDETDTYFMHKGNLER